LANIFKPTKRLEKKSNLCGACWSC